MSMKWPADDRASGDVSRTNGDVGMGFQGIDELWDDAWVM